MNKLGIIGGAVAVAAIIIIAVVAGGPKEGTPKQGGGSPEVVSGTFKDLIMSGKSYQCTFSNSDEMGEVNGQVFVAKENMVRGTYNMTDPDGNVFDMEVIQDGEFNYVWGDSPFGSIALKTKLEAADVEANEANFIESDTEFDFDCKRWAVQNSKFVPPSDVDFNEFSIPEIVLPEAGANAGAAAGGNITTQDICSSCDAAPEGAAREQCLQALSTFGC